MIWLYLAKWWLMNIYALVNSIVSGLGNGLLVCQCQAINYLIQYWLLDPIEEISRKCELKY